MHEQAFMKTNKVGVLGGGQLGRMLIESGKKMGLTYHVLESHVDCPAAMGAEKLELGSLQSATDIEKLAEEADVLTIEIEKVNAKALQALKEKGKVVIPDPQSILIIQNKARQRQYLAQHSISQPAFFVQKAHQSFESHQFVQFSNRQKVVLKFLEGGYDGKGVQIWPIQELEAQSFEQDLLVEDCIQPLEEYAILVAKGKEKMTSFPIVKMVVHEKGNLLDHLEMPAQTHQAEDLKKTALAAVEALPGLGLFAVEMFADGSNVYLNEIAPRPHNSGHQSIHNCTYSQYDQLNFLLQGQNPKLPKMHSASVMMNLLGPEGWEGNYFYQGQEEINQMQQVHLYDYGKSISKPQRKLGHLTLWGDDLLTLRKTLKELKQKVKVLPA
ncbi:MAG: N5-carboxyaminoimidazole ribonucleotide synthase [Bacteroidetes bacterium MED-G17]|nr:MAG: N5-carboxyaminoimidazole ribonucleotide synthase [Bacteroidetes bacterium MED-G17]